MRPQSFFSNKLDLEIVEDYSKADAEARQNEGKDWLSRLIELNLLLLIVLVGIPVLVYCLLSVQLESAISYGLRVPTGIVDKGL